MSFSALTASIDDSTRAELTDPFELRPAAGGDVAVIPAMVDQPVEPAGIGGPSGPPMLRAQVQVHVDDATIRKGDVLMPGAWLDGIEDGAFVVEATGWRVAGAVTKDDSGRWQTAELERFQP